MWDFFSANFFASALAGRGAIFQLRYLQIPSDVTVSGRLA